MKWSRLKARVEALFSDAVRGRFELHTTRYRKAHDQMGRGWITADKREIISMCDYLADAAHYVDRERSLKESGLCHHPIEDWAAYWHAYHRADKAARDRLHEQGVHARQEFRGALEDYLNMSIEDILASQDPLIRAIGMLDRRLGKRRLSSMDTEAEHPLVRQLFEFRCQAEHLNVS